MLWKLSARPTPVKGDTRTIARFAWLPVRLGDTKVWLEQYELLQAWDVRDVQVGKDGLSKVGQWVTVSSKIVKWEQA